MNESRELRLRVIATKEDNPWLPEDVGIRRGVSVCNPISHRPTVQMTVDEMVDLEMQSAGRFLLEFLRREGLIEPRR